MARISHCSISVLILLLVSVSSCFDSYYGTINAEDAMHWIQQSQAAGDWSDLTTRRFWSPDDSNIDPARKAADDSVNDVRTPWKCNFNPGWYSCTLRWPIILIVRIGSFRITAVNLAPTGVSTTWAQVRMAVLSILSSNTEANRLSQLNGGSVYLGKLFKSLAHALFFPSSNQKPHQNPLLLSFITPTPNLPRISPPQP